MGYQLARLCYAYFEHVRVNIHHVECAWRHCYLCLYHVFAPRFIWFLVSWQLLGTSSAGRGYSHHQLGCGCGTDGTAFFLSRLSLSS